MIQFCPLPFFQWGLLHVGTYRSAELSLMAMQHVNM